MAGKGLLWRSRDDGAALSLGHGGVGRPRGNSGDGDSGIVVVVIVVVVQLQSIFPHDFDVYNTLMDLHCIVSLWNSSNTVLHILFVVNGGGVAGRGSSCHSV